jgi:hypothetical protein
VRTGTAPAVFLLHVVAEQQALVAQVQLAVGDDRVRPGRGAAALRLVEVAAFDVLVGVRFHQDHRAALVAVVQPSVRRRDRALARPVGGPLHLAGLELNAGQPAAVVAVHVPPHEDHAAVVVLHVAGEIDLLGLNLVVAVAAQPGQPAAGAIVGRGKDAAVVENRRRAVGRAVVRPVVAPQELAVGGQADDAAAEELDVLAFAGKLNCDNRGIIGVVVLRHHALPDDLAGLLVEGQEGRLAPAGGAEQALAVD